MRMPARRPASTHEPRSAVQARPGRQAQPPARQAGAPSAFEHDFSRIPVHPAAPGTLQFALRVNTPGDPHEQEADRVAEQVMRMPLPGPGDECGCRGGAAGGQVQRRASAGGRAAGTVPPLVERVLRSPGQPLDASTRAFMEPRFGRDFSRVRIHSDAEASRSAASVNALAYAVGPHVVMGAGQYAPATPHGRRLLGHELTHVVQQSAAGAAALQRQSAEDPVEVAPTAPVPLSPDAAHARRRRGHPRGRSRGRGRVRCRHRPPRPCRNGQGRGPGAQEEAPGNHVHQRPAGRARPGARHGVQHREQRQPQLDQGHLRLGDLAAKVGGRQSHGHHGGRAHHGARRHPDGHGRLGPRQGEQAPFPARRSTCSRRTRTPPPSRPTSRRSPASPSSWTRRAAWCAGTRSSSSLPAPVPWTTSTSAKRTLPPSGSCARPSRAPSRRAASVPWMRGTRRPRPPCTRCSARRGSRWRRPCGRSWSRALATTSAGCAYTPARRRPGRRRPSTRAPLR
jgi:hypothetical protein